MNQKEAVYAAFIAVGIVINEGEAINPTKEQRAQVNAILFEGFRSNKIKLEREFTDKELKSYVSGLQSNWIRKDKRLNGNVEYVAANPGSRAGSGDATLKAMRALLTTLTTAEDKAEVQGCIDAHLATLATAKVKTIDFTKLPEALRNKFTK
jgi:hypothetical protein